MRTAGADVVTFSVDAPPMTVHDGDLHIWLIQPSRWPAVDAFVPCRCALAPRVAIGRLRERRRAADATLGRTLLSLLLRECDDGRMDAPLHGAMARTDGLLAIGIGRVGRVTLRLATAAAHAAGDGFEIPGLPDGYRGSIRTASWPARLLVATLHADRPAMTMHYCGVPLVSANGRSGPRFHIQ
jgi:hypothetical protein